MQSQVLLRFADIASSFSIMHCNYIWLTVPEQNVAKLQTISMLSVRTHRLPFLDFTNFLFKCYQKFEAPKHHNDKCNWHLNEVNQWSHEGTSKLRETRRKIWFVLVSMECLFNFYTYNFVFNLFKMVVLLLWMNECRDFTITSQVSLTRTALNGTRGAFNDSNNIKPF